MKMPPLAPHRLWLGLLLMALVVWLAGALLAHYGVTLEQRRAAALAAEQQEMQEAAARFHDDIDLAQRTGGQMTADDIDRLLAPVDRLRVVAALERQAAAARFSHFTYTLAPEKKAREDAMEALSLSDVSLSADMPLDTDAYNFVGALPSVLPGRVRVRQLTLSRPAQDTLTLGNIHMELVLEWLSNGTDKEHAP